MLFFILFLSFCLRVIRKGLRKNSEIFVNLGRSSDQSMRERSDRWPLFLVFKSVPGCIEGIPRHYGTFRGIMGCSRGVPGLFRAVPGCSGGVPGLFRGVPGCSGVYRGVPGCSGFYRHPLLWGGEQCICMKLIHGKTLPSKMSRKSLAEQFTLWTWNDELDFSSTILNFFIPFGTTEVVILFYFRELLYEQRIDGTSEQMSSSSRSDSRV